MARVQKAGFVKLVSKEGRSEYTDRCRFSETRLLVKQEMEAEVVGVSAVKMVGGMNHVALAPSPEKPSGRKSARTMKACTDQFLAAHSEDARSRSFKTRAARFNSITRGLVYAPIRYLRQTMGIPP